MPRVSSVSRRCSDTTSHCEKNSALVLYPQPVAQVWARDASRPQTRNVHAECAAISGDDLSYAPITPDAQGLATQYAAQPEIGGHGCGPQTGLLPCAVLEVGDV